MKPPIIIQIVAHAGRMQNKKHTIRDKKNTFRSCHRRELGRAGGGVFSFRKIEFWLSAGRRAERKRATVANMELS
jgi:hypothetical protein